MPGWVLPVFIPLLIIFLIGFIRFAVSVAFYDKKLSVKASVGFFTLSLYPPGEKKHGRKRKKPKADPPKPDQADKNEDEGENKFSDMLGMASAILAGVRRVWRPLLRGIHIGLSMTLTAATGDAAKTALLYGRLCAALGVLIPLLDSLFTLKKADVELNADFDASKIKLDGDIRISSSIGRILSCSVLFLIVYLAYLIKKKNDSPTNTTKDKAVQSP